MITRNVDTDPKEVQKALLRGVNKVADAVELTLGPKGKTVAIQNPHGPGMRVTKDGVTVARNIILEDPKEEMGAALIREVSLRSNEIVGDGTTTSVVLARAMVNSCIGDSSPINLKQLGDEAERIIRDELTLTIDKPENIRKVSFLSSNGDNEIADIVAEAYAAVGTKGVVLVEESKKPGLSFQKVDGATLSWGMASPIFANIPEKGICELDGPAVIIFEGRLDAVARLLPMFETAAKSQQKLVIIAEDFGQDLLAFLHINNQSGALQTCCVTHGGNLSDKDDLEHILNLKFIENRNDFIVGPENMAPCNSVKVTRNEISFVGPNSDPEKIAVRTKFLENLKTEAKTEAERQGIEARIARLYSGIGIIHVGAETVSTAKEVKDRVDDAVFAVRSALAHGVTPGGGMALAYVAGQMYDNRFANALRRPYELLHKDNLPVTNPWNGTDLRTGKTDDLFEMGVFDPAMATIMAVRNAVEVANLVLSTACLITNTEKKEDK